MQNYHRGPPHPTYIRKTHTAVPLAYIPKRDADCGGANEKKISNSSLPNLFFKLYKCTKTRFQLEALTTLPTVPIVGWSALACTQISTEHPINLHV